MKIIIVGAGFAGLAALGKINELISPSDVIDVQIFDKNLYTTIVPALPDYIGNNFENTMLAVNYHYIIPNGVRFVNRQVDAIDLDASTITAGDESFAYDYLLMSAGSTTNFFGFDQHRESVYKLDAFNDAKRIKSDFKQYVLDRANPHVVIVGAGYTGIELAFNMIIYAQSLGKKIRVSLVEIQDKIMGMLTDSQRSYVQRYLNEYNIDVHTTTQVEQFDGKNVRLKSGCSDNDVFFCWTAGTKISLYSINGTYDALKDGRIKVSDTLQVSGYPTVFVAGDCAAVEHSGNYLRKAVNFSIYSGKAAGRNIVMHMDKKKLEPFQPFDLGWILPLRVTSVGKLFSRIPVHGPIGMRLHYLMCGMRNYTLENKRKFISIATTFSKKELNG